MLRLAEVEAGYGLSRILQGVSLSVSPGEVVAVMGRNGVGKTTLLKTIVGLLPVRNGTIWLDGEEITRVPSHARTKLGMGYVPQGRRIFPRMSVSENLRVAGIKAGEESTAELLAEFPKLRPLLDHLGSDLSGGEQQILAIARALATRPSLILLDEPTEGVQPTVVAEIAEILARLNEQRGTTLVLVEQNLEFAGELASRAYVMEKGVVSTEIAMDRLLADKALQHHLMGV